MKAAVERPTATLRENCSAEALSVACISLDEDSAGFVSVFAESGTLVRLASHLETLRLEDAGSLPDSWTNSPPDICLIDFDRDRYKASRIAEKLHATLSDTSVFAVSSYSDATFILDAMRSGCTEYLIKPLERQQLVSALVRVAPRKKERKETYRAEVIAFLGAKGGCGVTTLATQMGALLAGKYSRKALLLDVHPDCGDVSLYLGLERSEYHLYELLESVQRLDAELLHSYTMRHSSGLDVVAAPERLAMARYAEPGALSEVLEYLRFRYEFVVADLPPTLTDQSCELIRQCDQLYLVTVAEVSSIRNVVRQLDFLKRNDLGVDRTRVVLNRWHKRNHITDDDVEKAIGQSIYWKVPNQYVHAVKSITSGNPIADISSFEVTKSIHEWAATHGRQADTEAGKELRKKPASLLSMFRKQQHS
ncbi:MAG: AAA family ATPase [Acidobacteriales bacterium]|nr:AAA family ATPase [Terriglobales bacterium]